MPHIETILLYMLYGELVIVGVIALNVDMDF